VTLRQFEQHRLLIRVPPPAIKRLPVIAPEFLNDLIAGDRHRKSSLAGIICRSSRGGKIADRRISSAQKNSDRENDEFFSEPMIQSLRLFRVLKQTESAV